MTIDLTSSLNHYLSLRSNQIKSSLQVKKIFHRTRMALKNKHLSMPLVQIQELIMDEIPERDVTYPVSYTHLTLPTILRV